VHRDARLGHAGGERVLDRARPGKGGRSDGWTLTTLSGKRSRNGFVRSCM
jgi:hypothetical protein